MMAKESSYSELIMTIKGRLGRLRQRCENENVSKSIMDEIIALEHMLSVEKGHQSESELSAQLSLYPLRQPKLSPFIQQALQALMANDLQVIPGEMSTLILGTETQLWQGLQDVFSTVAAQGEVVLVVTVSNACPKPYK
jgi:uncharacterized protein YqgV (UPF0045/DUF77 family)